jgi:DNA polymerase III sliding clamp (beta) subunit (PCNA family)
MAQTQASTRYSISETTKGGRTVARINREILLSKLESVLPGLSTREVVDQSSCFVFKNGEVVTFNDEITCRQKVDTKLECAVQATPFLSLLRKLPEDEIDLEVSKGELIVNGKNRKAGILMDADVTLTKVIEERCGKRPKNWESLHEDFNDAVSIVQQCAGKDQNEFWSTCVHLAPKYMEAYDNYHLTRYKLKTGVSTHRLVRATSIAHISSMGMMKIAESDEWLHFQNPSELVFSCRHHPADDYPNITSLIDVSGTRTVFPKGLADAAERALIFSNENVDDNLVTVELRTGKLRLRGQGVSGWFTEVKRIKYNGKPISFLISPALLIELTKRHNECEVTKESLKVDGNKFVYISCLQQLDEKGNGKKEG